MSHFAVNVLLVEDDDVDAECVERAFEKYNLTNPIVRAKDGVEALRILRGNSEERLDKPYLLLVDLNMPRMNGLEFIEAVRKDSGLRKAVIFVLTTSKSEDDKHQVYTQNVAGYLVKADIGHDFGKLTKLIKSYSDCVEFP